MIFNDGYYNAMDRAYEFIEDLSINAPSEEPDKVPVVGIKDVGHSVVDGGQAGTFSHSVKAAIFGGTSNIELQPKMEGEGFAVGVEYYGEEEREEIKAIAKVNEVDITSVHTPFQINNLSGYNQGQFSEAQRFSHINEMHKHIKFAADVTDGGAIVVHTGEYPRSIAKGHWNDEKQIFEAFPGEEYEAIQYLVDERTGKIVDGVKEDREVWLPVQKESDGQKEWVTDPYSGERIKDSFTNDYIPIFEINDQGQIMTQKTSFGQFRDNYLNENAKKTDVQAAVEFFRMQHEAQLQESLGMAREYEVRYKEHEKRRGKILNALKEFRELKEKTPEEQQWKLKQTVGRWNELIPADVRDPVEYLEEVRQENEAQLYFAGERAVASRRQARDIQDNIKYVVPVDEFGKRVSFDSMAQLGVYAMQLTDERKLDRPLNIAPENIFPEMGYGSHPDELIELVHSSRDRMVEILTNAEVDDPSMRRYTKAEADKLGIKEGTVRKIPNPWYKEGMSTSEAEKEANEHIRATFDTQHLAMWYKHFKREPGRSEEEHIKVFNKWYMSQIKKLSEADILGNVHLVDGFGLGHTHTTVGQGLFPVAEAVEYLKEHGYGGSITSEAYGTISRIVTGAWEAFGSPVYALSKEPTPMTFSNVQHSYFGAVRPPSYIVGPYAPSEDFTMWSQVPLE